MERIHVLSMQAFTLVANPFFCDLMGPDVKSNAVQETT